MASSPEHRGRRFLRARGTRWLAAGARRRLSGGSNPAGRPSEEKKKKKVDLGLTEHQPYI